MQPACVEQLDTDRDRQSVFTAANLIIVLPIVGTGPKITGKSLDRHQMP